MKKLVAVILSTLLVLVACTAYATADVDVKSINVSALTDAEIVQLLRQILGGATRQQMTDALEGASDGTLAILAEVLAAEQQTRATSAVAQQTSLSYQRGDKNDAVKRIQERLIALNYLEGSADGDYGKKTETAISVFQKAVNLPQTGVADPNTQAELFDADAPAQKKYDSFSASIYDKISRDPDSYEYNLYKITGKVLQVMEDDEDGGTVATALRVATKGRYDNVIYVYYLRPVGEKRILEDDKVTILGISRGLYSYETVMGAEITIPLVHADAITVN